MNIVVYDQKSEHTNQLDLDNSFPILLLKKLAQKYKSVSFLIEGFVNFERMYPELCESTSGLYLPIVSLDAACKPKHLRLKHSLSSYVIDLNSSSNSAVSSASSEHEPKLQVNYLASPTEHHSQPHTEPTKILDFLFLGSQENALSRSSLHKLGITCVLNVSITCPKADHVLDADFLRVPINDGHSAKIISYFEVAFKFVEKCRKANKRVLVHCLAGISRSPTLAIAYLMKHMNMRSDEAFKFVKDKRATISPNFNFLGQLYDYEKQLIRAGLLQDAEPGPSADTSGHAHTILFASSRKKLVYDFADKNFVLNRPGTLTVHNLHSPSTAFSNFSLNSPIVEKQTLAKSFTFSSMADMGQTSGKTSVVMRRPTNLSLVDSGAANRLKRPSSILLDAAFGKKVEPGPELTELKAQTECNKKKLKLGDQQSSVGESGNRSSVVSSPLGSYGGAWNVHLGTKLNNDMNIKSNEMKRMFLSSENLRDEQSKSREEAMGEEAHGENNENSLILLNANKSNSSSSSSNKNSLHGSTETMIEVL